MESTPPFQLETAHRYFAADCYNRAWELIQKEDRTEEENQAMLATSYASLFHWLNRTDCAPVNHAIAYWQLSRIYALLDNPQEARAMASLCLKFSDGLEPFYTGYAYEAFARAEKIAGNAERAEEFKRKALSEADKVTDAEEKSWLVNDLATI